MSLPGTLLSHAGVVPAPASLDRAAVVVIDAQRQYTGGPLALSGVKDAIAEIADLLAAARGRATPVFHIVHHARPGAALFDPEAEGAAIVPGLEPVDDETTIIKSLPNAFAGTGLEAALRATGRTELIVVGFATHMCA